MIQAIRLCALKSLMHQNRKQHENWETFRVNFGTNTVTDMRGEQTLALRYLVLESEHICRRR